jgi:hypothetical protein
MCNGNERREKQREMPICIGKQLKAIDSAKQAAATTTTRRRESKKIPVEL